MFKKLPLELNEAIFDYLPIEDLVKHLEYPFVFRIIKKKYNKKTDTKIIIQYVEVIKYFIEQGIIHKDTNFIHMCIINSSIEVVKYLIEQGMIDKNTIIILPNAKFYQLKTIQYLKSLNIKIYHTNSSCCWEYSY